MPIKPENKDRYPADWKQIRARILKRAKNHCEECGVENGATGYRTPAGAFVCLNSSQIVEYERGQDRATTVVLTIGHLDHQPEHCQPSNLNAWCQRCHLVYDIEHHRGSRFRTMQSELEEAGQQRLECV